MSAKKMISILLAVLVGVVMLLGVLVFPVLLAPKIIGLSLVALAASILLTH